MNSNELPVRSRHRHRQHRRRQLSSDEIDTIELDSIPSSAQINKRTVAVFLPTTEQEHEHAVESPLVKIILRKRRKAWAKLVAPVDESKIKKNTESFTAKFTKLFSKIPSPIQSLLGFIEHRSGFTIRSYFEFIVWLFYLNIFTFILCFTCIIMPTYIYPNSIEFSSYAMNEYNKINDIPIYNYSDQCTLTDPQCESLNIPLSSQDNVSNNSCLDNSYTASSCCSLHTESYFVNSSRDGENDWTEYLIDLIDGTGSLTLNRLFIGYYRNLTKSNDDGSYFQTYNMGLAVFLTIFACLLVTGIIIVRKFGDGMRKSYVQNESFENNLFQYIFARWNYRSVHNVLARRHEQRFKSEIKNILFELDDKRSFKFERAKDKIIFQIQRLCLWLITIIIFGGAITILYFTHRFSFQERAKKEMNNDVTGSNRFLDMLIEYLPSIIVSVINLTSQLVFAYMRDFKLYTRTSALRHYLIRVIIMRLVLLFSFVFIIILQITCNSNQCGRQSELIECAEIKGKATFIHCWETLIGQAIYRLVLTDTVVMLIVHLIVDPIRTLLRRCFFPEQVVQEQDGTTIKIHAAPKTWFLFQPLEFEVGDYVLDLTYSQTLCWHGILFCPYLPLIAAVKNIIIFATKSLSLAFFRKRSGLELSPARARYIFTSVLLFSFVWALLPIAFLSTSLRPSRGCGPFRLYSHEPDFYLYYSVRNVFSQVQNRILVQLLFKLTSAVVIVPLVLILILISCILIIRRNSYRGASVELYKLLYSSHKTHQLAVNNPTVMSVAL
ncbi:unnamed protein product [Adineta steineri]|uniref:TMC domain-containing protein n=2 Tax=Adineta steineri TaxID=433720 RepID=A0A813XVE7_9BILA|nr:unnamed protein product [Adineta steineri]CAF0875341.1 unnamed protein product [Adineta steineri]